MLSLTVKKLDAFEFDRVTESDNSAFHIKGDAEASRPGERRILTIYVH